MSDLSAWQQEDGAKGMMEGPVRMFLQKSQKDGLAEWQSPPVRGVTSGLLPLLNGQREAILASLDFWFFSHLPRTLLSRCPVSRASGTIHECSEQAGKLFFKEQQHR